MMYCEKCGISFETDCCPTCGSKSLRSPQPDDMCFLTEKDILWSEMLEDILKQNNVPILTRKALGIGMALKVGPMSERVKVYVPYAHLQESRIIVESLFSAPKGGECD